MAYCHDVTNTEKSSHMKTRALNTGFSEKKNDITFPAFNTTHWCTSHLTLGFLSIILIAMLGLL